MVSSLVSEYFLSAFRFARAVASLTATTRQLPTRSAGRFFGHRPPFCPRLGIKIAGLGYRNTAEPARLTSIQLSKRTACQALVGLTVCPLIEMSIAYLFKHVNVLQFSAMGARFTQSKGVTIRDGLWGMFFPQWATPPKLA